ncbi:DUF4259 domain-containing protein [Kribbella sp. NPDC056345]|uniref:DUF4259 domain-containing protein n=1 Tax=Kribbella sp. NPDC056345 TaxID=3345789 RepID=UPI0035D7119C
MGSWGTGPFDDDTAMDFIDALADTPTDVRLRRLAAAVDRLLLPQNAEDYTMAVEAVAAAAILAGAGVEQEQTATWEIPPLTADRAEAAMTAVANAYADHGIIAELAAEAGTLSEHRAAIEPVRERLRAAIPPPQDEVLF